jgi:hypothetical protein
MPPLTLHRSVLLLLVIVSLVALGGCLSQFGTESTNPGDRNTCPDEQVTSVPYPDRPATLTNESVQAFIADLEQAYVYNREADEGNVTNISFDPEPDDVIQLEDGWSLRLETGISEYRCVDGSLSVGDGYYTARYFLNESAIYRAQNGGDGPVGDPRKYGTRIRTSNATNDR